MWKTAFKKFGGKGYGLLIPSSFLNTLSHLTLWIRNLVIASLVIPDTKKY